MDTDIEVKLYEDVYSKYWKAECGQTLGNEYLYDEKRKLLSLMNYNMTTRSGTRLFSLYSCDYRKKYLKKR